MTTEIKNPSGETIAAFNVKPQTPVLNKRNGAQLSNINYTINNRGGSYFKFHDVLHVVTYSDNFGKPLAEYYWRDRKTPESFYYTSVERRTDAIKYRIEKARVYNERINERKQAKKARPVPTMNVGDVLSTSWGYEQTNVEFYQVIERNKKTGITIQEISSKKIDDTSWCSANVKPIKDSFIGEPLKKRIGSYGVKIHSSATATLTTWDSSHHRSWGY